MEETTTHVEVEVSSVSSEQSSPSKGISALFDRISWWLTAATLVLTPLIISFSSLVPTEFTKHTVFVLLVSLAFVFWALARITSGILTVPKSTALWSALLLLLLLLPSALFSGSLGTSFMGLGGESGTFISLLLYVILAFLVAIHARSPKYIVGYLSYLLGLGLFVFLIHMANIFVGPFSVFGSSGSLVGKWNDLGVFYGLVLVLSLFFTQVVGVVGRYKALAYTSLVTSLIGLIIVNFPNAWYLIGIFSVVVLIAGISRRRRLAAAGEQAPSWASFSVTAIVLLISLAFIFSGGPDQVLGSRVIDFQINRGVSSLEARPSYGSTFEVLGKTYREDPIFGAGLNRFAQQWVKYRPQSVNETPFWNVDFNAGVGYIITFAVTAGIIGVIGWLLFLAAAFVSGFKYTFSQGSHHEAQVALLTLYAGLSYLLLMILTYVTDSFLVALTFAFLGLMVATSVVTGMVKEKRLNMFSDARVRFPSLLVLVLLLIAVGMAGVVGGRRYLAFRSFQQGLASLNSGASIDVARESILKSEGHAPLDIYYRSLSEIETLRINQLLNTADIGEEELRAQFQNRLAAAIDAAEKARDYDPQNYLNHLALGRVYASLAGLPFEDAYDLANAAYAAAEDLAPGHPLVALERARLERSNENIDATRAFFNEALARKSNYTQALFELSLFELDQNNLQEAITRTEQAAVLSPQDEGLFFQLGFLKYQNEEYREAGVALERAVALNNEYANALYFLGLVYDELGFTDEAEAQFSRVLQFNPGNSHVEEVLANVQAGLPALRGLESPAESGELPVEEQ